VSVQLPEARAERWRPPCPPSFSRGREGDRGSAAAELRGAGGGLMVRGWAGGAAPASLWAVKAAGGLGGAGPAGPGRVSRGSEGTGRAPGWGLGGPREGAG
jgi:hypothetical protein